MSEGFLHQSFGFTALWESRGAAGGREGGLPPLGDGGARCQPLPHLSYREAIPVSVQSYSKAPSCPLPEFVSQSLDTATSRFGLGILRVPDLRIRTLESCACTSYATKK